MHDIYSTVTLSCLPDASHSVPSLDEITASNDAHLKPHCSLQLSTCL